MEHLVKEKEQSFEVVTIDRLERDVRHYLAEHFCVKLYWDVTPIDMNKKYQEGSLEAYRVRQNKCIDKIKKCDYETIFIDTVKGVCQGYYCVDFCTPKIFICVDNLDYKEYYDGAINYDIEKELMSRIDYKEILDYCETHTEDEIIEKYKNSLGEDYFFFHYV